MADASDLKSDDENRESSILSSRTIFKKVGKGTGIVLGIAGIIEFVIPKIMKWWYGI